MGGGLTPLQRCSQCIPQPQLTGQCKIEKAFKGADYIDSHITWLAPNPRFIFVGYKIKMHWCSWKHTACNYAVQSGSRNYLIYWCPTTFVLRGSESWILFLEIFFFTPCGQCRPMKKFRSVNPINTCMVLFTNPSARAGYDTRSIFKRSLTGLNSEFSFS